MYATMGTLNLPEQNIFHFVEKKKKKKKTNMHKYSGNIEILKYVYTEILSLLVEKYFVEQIFAIKINLF